MNHEIDVRAILPTIHVPTIEIARVGDPLPLRTGTRPAASQDASTWLSLAMTISRGRATSMRSCEDRAVPRIDSR